MKKLIVISAVLIAVAGLLALKSCSNSTDSSHGETEVGDGADCVAPAYWFPHSKTPPPKEGEDSPFAQPETDAMNCDFHLWSWQKFLYLTRMADNGRTNFENLVQVDNRMKKLGSMIILDDPTQAGGGATIYDKQNNPIYYAIFVNQLMYDTITSKINQIKKLPMYQDTISNADLHSHGFDVATYPVGSFEVKTSWILVSSLDPTDTSKYYRTQANVKGVISRVALLGMHITGRVINHPEFIWATYEHHDLAPTVTWSTNLQDTVPGPDSTQAISTKDYVFYKAGEPIKRMNIRYDSTRQSKTFFSTYRLFEHGSQPNYTGILPGFAAKDSQNLAHINQINHSVSEWLKKEDDVWQHYEYVGSIWTNPTISPLRPGNANIGGLDTLNVRGSRALSNITMETCEQLEWNFPNTAPPPFETGNTVASNSMNCFGCHASVDFKGFQGNGISTNLALSHLFNNSLQDTLMHYSTKSAKVKTKK